MVVRPKHGVHVARRVDGWIPKRIEHGIASAPPKSLGGSPAQPYKLVGWPDGTGSN